VDGGHRGHRDVFADSLDSPRRPATVDHDLWPLVDRISSLENVVADKTRQIDALRDQASTPRYRHLLPDPEDHSIISRLKALTTV